MHFEEPLGVWSGGQNGYKKLFLVLMIGYSSKRMPVIHTYTHIFTYKNFSYIWKYIYNINNIT